LKVYADTSFLVSLYSLDAQSAKAARVVHRLEPSVFLTPLVELELSNALELRVFRKEATTAEIRAARAEVQNHIADGFFTMAAMPITVYELARRIALKQTAAKGARTLDILHVASAILLRAEKFWTFDERQATVARTEGLRLR
jgi:predicted nucleic acid-binding protein